MAMKDVYIIDGKRTPQAKAGLDLKDVQAPFLGGVVLFISGSTLTDNMNQINGFKR